MSRDQRRSGGHVSARWPEAREPDRSGNGGVAPGPPSAQKSRMRRPVSTVSRKVHGWRLRLRSGAWHAMVAMWLA